MSIHSVGDEKHNSRVIVTFEMYGFQLLGLRSPHQNQNNGIYLRWKESCYFMPTNITSFHNISFTFADEVKCADTSIQLYQTLIYVSLSQMLTLIVQKLTSEELLKSGAAQGQN